MLAHNDVGVNLKDSTSGWTALSWAAEAGHEGVVTLLLTRTDVDVNLGNISDRTVLYWGATRVWLISCLPRVIWVCN